MEDKTPEAKNPPRNNLPSLPVVAFALAVSASLIYFAATQRVEKRAPTENRRVANGEAIELPVRWGDLGVKMVSVGVIDAEQFLALYARDPALKAEAEMLLLEGQNGNLKISDENAGLILNLLWPLGLGNKNPILDSGEMANPRYGGPDRFASTGGWTLSTGDPMAHYSRHPFIVLTPEQQSLVERVAAGIYRPCCNNPTSFPDCNHGMAMLALLELLASQDVSENEMYRVALSVNRLWFPDTYAAIEEYLKLDGKTLATADPKEILGADYSSASGYQKILARVTPPDRQSGAKCGV